MEKIISFMLFDHLESAPSPDGNGVAAQFTNPRSFLCPQYVPGNFTFAMAVITGGIDFSKKGYFESCINSPDGKTVQKFGRIDTPVIKDEDSQVPVEYQGFVMNMVVQNMNIPQTGIYHFVLYHDGKEIGKADIPVFLRKNGT